MGCSACYWYGQGELLSSSLSTLPASEPDPVGTNDATPDVPHELIDGDGCSVERIVMDPLNPNNVSWSTGRSYTLLCCKPVLHWIAWVDP